MEHEVKFVLHGSAEYGSVVRARSSSESIFVGQLNI